MTDTLPPPQAEIRRRNRRMLLLLLLVFFGGALLAGLLRFAGWRPDGAKNRGEMLQPYGDLREYAPALAGGGSYHWDGNPRTWRIVAMPRDCDGARTDACARLLDDLHKVHQLMGKEAYRVHLLWAGAFPAGTARPAEVRVIRPDQPLRAALAGPELAAGEGAPGDPVWLVDPHGFVVLRYPPGSDPGDLRYDLSRLLKIN